MPLRRIVIGLAATILICACLAQGAKLVLKDGSVLEGTVIPQGDNYWIRMRDGSTRMVAGGDVASADLNADSSGPSDNTVHSGNEVSENFRLAKRHADDVSAAIAAVAIWQQFIDKNPSSPDLPMAKQELTRWKTLADTGAEKINDGWVGGEQLSKIRRDSDDLIQEADSMMARSETVQALQKLKEAVKIYPNSFVGHFALGDISMFQRNYDEAVGHYQVAFKLAPKSTEALNNLAVANMFRRRFADAVEDLSRAVDIQDNKPLAQNLITALAAVPAEVRTQARFKGLQSTANLLAAKYDISGPSNEFFLMKAPRLSKSSPDSQLPPGIVGGGTGFLISDDGLILTNRHVVKMGKTLLVQMGKEQMSADIVAIDDNYDLALIRIKSDKKLPFLHFSPTDSPHDGADCTVLGYPLMFQIGLNIKITHGIVSTASAHAENGADVLTDAKVNPGNSGGPIVDKFGNVMAIVCMKTFLSSDADSYGIGISAGHIREFLARQHVNVTAGSADQSLSVEDVVAQVEPATVCILGAK